MSTKWHLLVEQDLRKTSLPDLSNLYALYKILISFMNVNKQEPCP